MLENFLIDVLGPNLMVIFCGFIFINCVLLSMIFLTNMSNRFDP